MSLNRIVLGFSLVALATAAAAQDRRPGYGPTRHPTYRFRPSNLSHQRLLRLLHHPLLSRLRWRMS